MFHILFNHPPDEEDLGGFHLLAIVSLSLDGKKVGLRDVLYLLQLSHQWSQARLRLLTPSSFIDPSKHLFCSFCVPGIGLNPGSL